MNLINTFAATVCVVSVLGLPLMISKLLFDSVDMGLLFWVIVILANFGLSRITHSKVDDE